MYADQSALEPVSFRGRMDEAKDVAATKKPGMLRARVNRVRPATTLWRSVAEASIELSVSHARVKLLCCTRRIPGAVRLKIGKGRPWSIPATLQPDGTYKIIVEPRSKGPQLRCAEPIPF